ncbi:Integral membrane protein GPR137B [Geodia barretti]|uniref:Integral membrane protein GPR137B n=1 Tax=Geodia barretti TaxID=519541 RepID=A0AA35WEV6_GEOBA|nr:Integral membrane protein GPR137B [Geodia barretti]
MMEEATISPTANEKTVSIATVEPSIHLAVTGTVTFFVGLLFFLVYLQLCMVIYYGYRLLSYQTILLFDILLWAALRLTLYSFYFYHCCELVGRLSLFFTWLLVAFPSALQFITLGILVHYFGENLYRVYERRKEMSSLTPPYKRLMSYRVFGWLVWLGSILLYLLCNIVFSVLIHLNSLRDSDGNPNQYLVVLRVVTLDGLFLLMGITLAVCMFIMYATKLGKDVLEAHNLNKWKPVTFSCVLFLLFVSRAIYDLISVTITVVNKEEMHAYGFGSSWMATDMADYEFKRKYGYVSYLSILFLWEVIPTYAIVIFFRVAFPFSTCRKLSPVFKTKQQSSLQRLFYLAATRY